MWLSGWITWIVCWATIPGARFNLIGAWVGLAAMLISCSPAHAAEPDMLRVREAICARESRDHNVPMIAVGDGGRARGECQIWVATAAWLIPYAVERGFVPAYMLNVMRDRSALAWFIHYTPINLGLADAYLDWMRTRKRIRTVRKFAYYWNAGHNSERFGAKPESVAYANDVHIIYKGPPPSSAAKQAKEGRQ